MHTITMNKHCICLQFTRQGIKTTPKQSVNTESKLSPKQIFTHLFFSKSYQEIHNVIVHYFVSEDNWLLPPSALWQHEEHTGKRREHLTSFFFLLKKMAQIAVPPILSQKIYNYFTSSLYICVLELANKIHQILQYHTVQPASSYAYYSLQCFWGK